VVHVGAPKGTFNDYIGRAAPLGHGRRSVTAWPTKPLRTHSEDDFGNNHLNAS
jgi:hypothetical protein